MNDCLALPALLVAVIRSWYVPVVPEAGVPARVATPFEPAVNVNPRGRFPVCDTVGTGVPVAVKVKLKAVPTVAVADATLVIVGAALTLATVSRRRWLPEPAVLVAVSTTG